MIKKDFAAAGKISAFTQQTGPIAAKTPLSHLIFSALKASFIRFLKVRELASKPKKLKSKCFQTCRNWIQIPSHLRPVLDLRPLAKLGSKVNLNSLCNWSISQRYDFLQLMKIATTLLQRLLLETKFLAEMTLGLEPWPLKSKSRRLAEPLKRVRFWKKKTWIFRETSNAISQSLLINTWSLRSTTGSSVPLVTATCQKNTFIGLEPKALYPIFIKISLKWPPTW